MIQLIKGMYGDLNCKAFDLSNHQTRTDDVIRNAGWFNAKGEKLGCGDLSLKDLKKIARRIECDEVFIILNENDTLWDIPSDLDQSAPGIEYVMKKAKWLVSGLAGTESFIYKIIEDADHSINKVYSEDKLISYFKASRSYLFDILEFKNNKFQNLKDAPTVTTIVCNQHYGLDVYHLNDGTSWALGNEASIISAAKFKAEELLWEQSIDVFKKHCILSDVELSIIANMISAFGSDSNSLIKKIVGFSSGPMREDLVKVKGRGNLLATYDGRQSYSLDIKGLPEGYFAYRLT